MRLRCVKQSGRKASDAKAKANLQPPCYVRQIDSKCPRGYCPSVKINKNNTYWKYRNEAFNKNKVKAKSYNPSFAN